jgi:hypothetical protein
MLFDAFSAAITAQYRSGSPRQSPVVPFPQDRTPFSDAFSHALFQHTSEKLSNDEMCDISGDEI